jgi:hypothetical protein
VILPARPFCHGNGVSSVLQHGHARGLDIELLGDLLT